MSEDEAAEAVAEIRELAAAAVAPVAATSRLTAPGDAPAPLVVDRPTWIEVNADSMAALLQPALERVASRRGKEPSAAAQAIGSKVTAVEAGGMLAFLSTKVLGQYDIAPDGTPALLLVAPNIVATERELGVTSRDFRLWVCPMRCSRSQGVPSVATIRERFTRRRKGAGAADRMLRRLLGLEAKMRQYRDGADFVRGVQEQVGVDGFNAVWTSPETLPTPLEITDPTTWVRRVHG